MTCKVETGRGLALAGIHPKAAGSGQELCSGDMLLEALIACAGVSLLRDLPDHPAEPKTSVTLSRH